MSTGVQYAFKVDELGIFEEQAEDTYPRSFFTVNSSYQDVRQLFQAEYVNSKWLDFQWIDILIE